MGQKLILEYQQSIGIRWIMLPWWQLLWCFFIMANLVWYLNPFFSLHTFKPSPWNCQECCWFPPILMISQEHSIKYLPILLTLQHASLPRIWNSITQRPSLWFKSNSNHCKYTTRSSLVTVQSNSLLSYATWDVTLIPKCIYFSHEDPL